MNGCPMDYVPRHSPSRVGISRLCVANPTVKHMLAGEMDAVGNAYLTNAVKYAIFLEANAKMQSAAIALGGQIKYISVDVARAMLMGRGDPDRAWDYWKRRAYGLK